LFDIIYEDEWKEEPVKGELSKDFGLYVERPFYIVSQLPSNKYLDLISNRNMVIKTRNGRNTQLWYFDQRSKTIKTKLNNQSWDIQSSGKTNNMQVWSTNSGWFQIFVYSEEHFCNIENKKCLDVTGSRDNEGQSVQVYGRTNNPNQRWKVIYQDTADKIPTKGLDKEFGFEINRPFYLVSNLPVHRVAECVGANNMVLRRYAKGRLGQQFYFDGVSRTIRSQQWKNYALEIQSNGGNSNLRFTSSINSRWW
jgi:hypothetical protein